MKTLKYPLLVLFTLIGLSLGAATVQVGVDPAKPWTGYMNVFATNYVLLFGNPWATADLNASFSGSTLAFTPNTSIDRDNPNDPYWWAGGASGAPNRIMDAGMYVTDDTLTNQTVTFSGTVISNSLASPYTCAAFIKDFAADYSSFTSVTTNLVGGQAFSITKTPAATGHHVQYGFEMVGPNARLATVSSLGRVEVATTAFGFSGNGNAGFGGAIGQGTLTLTDDGTTISGTLSRGPGAFNDVLVLYLDSVAGGFGDTGAFADDVDELRRAISGYAFPNRSTLTNQAGFNPEYAIALGPYAGGFGGLWQLAVGGINTLNFLTSVNLSPLGNANAATYTFSFDVSQLGLAPNSGATFKLLGTYIGASAYRSTEALPGNVSGTQGWNSFNTTTFATYSIKGPPTATTLSATDLSNTVATLNATVNPKGVATSYYFQFGPTTNYGSVTATNTLAGNNFTYGVSNSITGLLPGATTHFRIVAINALGTTVGSNQFFTTLPSAPSVVTLPATSISATTATLWATVNPNGTNTAFSFQYGTTTNYGSSTALTLLPAINLTYNPSLTLTSLVPATVYHFTITASNGIGTSSGVDAVFRTGGLTNVVLNTLDNGVGSLRDMVANAIAGDFITFAPGLSGQSILLTNGQITLNKSLTIDGSALNNGIRLNGNHAARIFSIAYGATVELNSLTVTNGFADLGGGLYNDGTLTVSNSTFAGNTSSNYGGGLFNSAQMTVKNCTFLSNSSSNGGGLFNYGGTANLSDCRLSGNAAASSGGGLGNGNARVPILPARPVRLVVPVFGTNVGVLTLTRSTLFGNSAVADGGGIYNEGTLAITNSTLTRNSGVNGGGLHNRADATVHGSTLSTNSAGVSGSGGGLYNAGTLTLNNSTLADNSASFVDGGGAWNSGALLVNHSTLSLNSAANEGGGIYSSNLSTLRLTNSIVADNLAWNFNDDIAGAFTGTNNLHDIDPRLAPLADYGGPTQTMPPLAGSPAINAGTDVTTNNFATDQRGLARLVGLHVDIGAVEAQLLLITQPLSITNLVGTTASFTVSAVGSPPLSFQWQKNGNALTDAGNVTGSTSNILTLSNVQLSDAASYTVAITNAYSSITSSVATLTVIPPPAITQQPQNVSAQCGSGTAVFSVTATGTAPLSYQWRFNGASLPGATGTNYTVSPTTLTNAGDYTVVITNLAGSVTSSIATLTLTNQTATVANADALSTFKNFTLTIPSAQFTSNDVAGSCNGANTNLAVISFSPTSANGGSLILQTSGTALWTNRYNGPGNGYDGVTAMVVGSNGTVFVTGLSYNGSSSYDYATIAYSSVGVPLWTNLFNGPGNNNDEGRALAVDGNGNVFVTGYSYNGSSVDYATIAYSGAGVPLWTNRYNGPGNSIDVAQAVAVGSNGAVFVTGRSDGGSGYDYATVAYSGAGVALWTNRYNGPASSDDEALALAVDGSGNAFVTGESYNGSSYDYATIAYSGAGVPLWTNRYNGPSNGNDVALAVAVNGGGNVFVSGNSTGSGSGYDYATIGYSNAGVPLWTNRYNGPGNVDDCVTAMVVGSNGTIFVAGSSYNGGLSDYATIAYSGAGVPLWTNRYNGPSNSSDAIQAMVVNSSGNVFVTGYSYGIGSSFDYATIAYSGAGVSLWTNRYNGPGNGDDNAQAIAMDSSGNVFVTGYSVDSSSGYDYATIKYYAGPAQVFYTPPTNFTGTDTFTYMVQDSLGQSATGTVTVTVNSLALPTLAQPPTVANGNFEAHFAGVPGGSYLIQVLTNLTATWQPFLTITASPTGEIVFTTPINAAPMRYFRVIPAP